MKTKWYGNQMCAGEDYVERVEDCTCHTIFLAKKGIMLTDMTRPELIKLRDMLDKFLRDKRSR